MTVVDFIDVIDDIIDLSSDEETVEQDHNAIQPQATLLGKQAVLVLAGEERQNDKAAFVSAGEGSQEATGSANATTSPSVMGKVSLDTSEPKNCSSSPTSAPLPGPTCTTPKAATSEVGDTQLVGPTCTTLKARLASPLVMEKAPLATAESKNGPKSPALEPLPSPASTTPKVVTCEDGDTKLVGVRHTKKKYLTSTPKRSPRCEQKPECRESPVEERVADHKRLRKLDTAEESASSADNAESTKNQHGRTRGPISTTPKAVTSEDGDRELVATASPSVMEKAPLATAESKECPKSPESAPLPGSSSTTPKALTCEYGDTKLVRVRHPKKKKYHTSTPRRSPRFELKPECRDSPVDEPAADHKRPRMLDPAQE